MKACLDYRALSDKWELLPTFEFNRSTSRGVGALARYFIRSTKLRETDLKSATYLQSIAIRLSIRYESDFLKYVREIRIKYRGPDVCERSDLGYTLKILIPI